MKEGNGGNFKMVQYLKLVNDDPETAADDWLRNASDTVLACRGQGHSWPKIKPGRMKRGVRAVPLRDGCYEFIITCHDCGMERRLVTAPGGSFDYGSSIYSYRAPDGYRAPRGTAITRRQCLGETMRRVTEDMPVVVESPVS